MHKGWIGAAAFVAMVCAGTAASAAELASLASPGLAGIRMAGFEIGQDATVEITAVGREDDEDGRALWSGGDDNGFSFGRADRSGNGLSAYAWIIDANSREPVWKMDVRDTDRGEMGSLVESTESVDLPAGRYEVRSEEHTSELQSH